MTLQQFLSFFRLDSGRYDLVDDNGADTGALSYINAALRWLESLVEAPAIDKTKVILGRIGEGRYILQRCKNIKSVVIKTTDGFTELAQSTSAKLRELYDVWPAKDMVINGDLSIADEDLPSAWELSDEDGTDWTYSSDMRKLTHSMDETEVYSGDFGTMVSWSAYQNRGQWEQNELENTAEFTLKLSDCEDIAVMDEFTTNPFTRGSKPFHWDAPAAYPGQIPDNIFVYDSDNKYIKVYNHNVDVLSLTLVSDGEELISFPSTGTYYIELTVGKLANIQLPKILLWLKREGIDEENYIFSDVELEETDLPGVYTARVSVDIESLEDNTYTMRIGFIQRSIPETPGQAIMYFDNFAIYKSQNVLDAGIASLITQDANVAKTVAFTVDSISRMKCGVTFNIDSDPAEWFDTAGDKSVTIPASSVTHSQMWLVVEKTLDSMIDCSVKVSNVSITDHIVSDIRQTPDMIRLESTGSYECTFNLERCDEGSVTVELYDALGTVVTSDVCSEPGIQYCKLISEATVRLRSGIRIVPTFNFDGDISDIRLRLYDATQTNDAPLYWAYDNFTLEDKVPVEAEMIVVMPPLESACEINVIGEFLSEPLGSNMLEENFWLKFMPHILSQATMYVLEIRNRNMTGADMYRQNIIGALIGLDAENALRESRNKNQMEG